MIQEIDNTPLRLKRDILPYLQRELAEVLHRVDMHKLDKLEEIRLRAEKPLILKNYKNEWFVSTEGELTGDVRKAVIVNQKNIMCTLEQMSENSIYAFQEEIRNGFLTLRGGHRIGIAGRVVYDGETVKNIKDISGLNIRLSREVPGCARKIMPYLIKGRNTVYNTLVISPPQCGKTTLLRDMARTLSDGIPGNEFKGLNVGIVDERSEIAACFRGIPQNNVGIRTDVLDGCLKSIGITMMIRSMSPNVIITDEIGCEGDRYAVHGALNAGVKIITSAHGFNISELKSRREVLRLMEDKVFERYVVLDNSRGPGTLAEIIDGETMKCVEGEGCHDI